MRQGNKQVISPPAVDKLAEALRMMFPFAAYHVCEYVCPQLVGSKLVITLSRQRFSLEYIFSLFYPRVCFAYVTVKCLNSLRLLKVRLLAAKAL